ncbi:MAG: hypothetical protein IBJ07_12280 [Rhizobiaceae bacterium]|nr:hypothetical protein [Rhizobiaceae bacterium]
MPRVNAPVYSLNGGEVGKEALARLDLERLQFAGSLYSNILPRIIGSMTLRPGLEHIADIDLGEVQLIEYAYSGGSAFIPVLSNGEMRVVQDNAFISRAAVATTVTNGAFASFSGWTDASDGVATATVQAGLLRLSPTTQNRASARQTVSVALADRNVEHGLRIDVSRGPVKLRLGSSAGADDLIPEAMLEDGTHSIAFTPTTASIYVELFADVPRLVYVDTCQIEASGTVVIPTPWTSSDLAANIIRYKQNIDVIYTASGFYQQREIQRRSDRSWGVQAYKVYDGPFVRGEASIGLTPSVYTGNGTLTSNRNYFDPSMLGRLFRLVPAGQVVTETFTTGPAVGAPIRISGVGSARRFNYSTSGSWTGSVTLQIATDDGSGNPGAWSTLYTFTGGDAYDVYEDPDNNVIKYLRFSATSISSGSAICTLSYAGGSAVGIVRMAGYTSPTSISVEVIERLLSTQTTFEWDFSTWSDYDGWPTAVEAFGARLYWGKGDLVYGSVPGSYRTFDDQIEGDSAPIARSIGSGTDRGILWLIGLQRLIAGTDSAEVSIKSSSFDEPLTVDRWLPLATSTQGSKSLRAVQCDTDGIFVQSSGTGIFSLSATQQGSLDYGALDLTEMHELICDGSPVVDLAVQRRPDSMVWFVLANGEARALTYRPGQKVIAWSRIVTDGLFKRVAAIRGAKQDNVYFAIERDGTQRLERLSDLDDCRGGALNCLADGFSKFTATAGQTTFPVPHLDGLAVTVWANGAALHDQAGLYTVAGGQVVLPPQTEGAKVVIGLPYAGKWQSTKLAYGAAGGTALFQKKRVSQLGMYLTDTMLDGLRVGKDFATLRKLTTTKNDKPIPANHLWDEFDADMMSVSSDWDTDSRICIEARSPYPFTAASLVLDLKTNG